MNATVADAIAAYIAELEPVVETPGEPFFYGTDISCTTDVPETFPDVDPKSTRAIAEAVIRRLDCPRGALVDDADYGLDLRAMCNRGCTAQEIRTLAGRVRAEVEKDDRVDTSSVIVTPMTPDGKELRVQIVIVPADYTLERFKLTLAATPASILLEELRAA